MSNERFEKTFAPSAIIPRTVFGRIGCNTELQIIQKICIKDYARLYDYRYLNKPYLTQHTQ